MDSVKRIVRTLSMIVSPRLCVLLLWGLLCTPAFALAEDQSVVGRWEGTVAQPGAQHETYPVVMVFTADDAGTVDYASLKCGGTLTLEKKTGNTYLFREHIDRGKDSCIDNGLIEIVITNATEARWSWWPDKGTERATAAITRTKVVGVASDLSPDHPPVFAKVSNEPVLLRYKLKEDQVLKLDVDLNTDIAVKQGAERMKMNMSMRMEAKVAVTGVDGEGNITAVTKLTRMQMTVKGPSTVEFDSDKPDDANEAFKPVMAMIGVGIPVKLSPLGEMLETDLEPLRQAARKAGDAALSKQFEDSTKKMFEGTFVQFSKAAMSIGEVHVAGTQVDDKMKMHQSYKLVAVSEDKTHALLEPMATIEIVPDAESGMEMKLKSQEVKGWELFDIEKGCPGDMQMRMHLVFDVKADGETGTLDTNMTIAVKARLE